MSYRVNPAGKFVLILLSVSVLIGGFVYLKNNTNVLSKIAPKSKQGTVPKGIFGGGGKDDGVIKIGVVTWGGYAGGQYFNEGFEPSESSRYYKEYGIKVQFKVLDDFLASRAAWKADEVNLLWCTIDAFPTEVSGLSEYSPKVVFQADWSRGGDAIVAKQGINSTNDLIGKKIAVAFGTPSHTFLLYALDAGNLAYTDVEVIEVANAIDAAATFKSGKVDAAVVWSPDDEDCVTKVLGAKVLMSTKKASYIIADVFIAKDAWIQSHQKELKSLIEGWMTGAAEINSSDVAKKKAAKILSVGLKIDEAFCYNAINNTRLCTWGDNKRFFGIDQLWTGMNGEKLYSKMTKVYRAIGLAKTTPGFEEVISITALNTISPSGEQEAEGAVTYKASEGKKAKVVSTKSVTINFPTGVYTLDANSKTIVDIKFADLLQMSTNMIRIEGNTDNVGTKNANIALSKKRAQSVADYLAQKYNISHERFMIIGNGPDKPVGDNSTDEGREKNRRTDFMLLEN